MNIPDHIKGLTQQQVTEAHIKYGYNELEEEEHSKWHVIVHILSEPMILLLLAIITIYLFLGEYHEAIFMGVAVLILVALELYQHTISDQALDELKKLSEPTSNVIRDGEVINIPTKEIVVGDWCVVVEGNVINADGIIHHSNDFSVNESSLTGESHSIFKDVNSDDKAVYNGTTVVSGLAIFEVNSIGVETRVGKIGKSLADIEKASSPLHIQIQAFVKSMAIIGIVVFCLFWMYNYFITGSVLSSLLTGLTLAMSLLPEEIPVAFTTFMALGAWKMMKDGVIVKNSGLVETLGSTTVICTDKTGTITQNVMQLKGVYNHATQDYFSDEQFQTNALQELLYYAMLSSEPVPFDPMEKELHAVYNKCEIQPPTLNLIHEYPLEGKPPMMTHVYEDESGKKIIAAKGAPEAILAVCQLSPSELEGCRSVLKEMGSKGYRILGVAKSSQETIPVKQQDILFQFLGFTIFYDPPKEGIRSVFKQIEEAGIQLKVITGDNADTTRAIAEQAGVIAYNQHVSGADITGMDHQQLEQISEGSTLFTRMFPEAKLEVVNALKRRGEVVAMLGDGVNDAPALKSAHIGVAMGVKGTEIAKAAADLVITDDDLSRLITGIAAGRRIYTNLKKAIQYIISIHIPIIMMVSVPLLLGWIYPHIFTPIHVIFLELVMGPTCSIVYENEPMEKNTMQQPPRKLTETFLSWKELNYSILQGLVIGLGVLFVYWWTVSNGGDEVLTRSRAFATLVLANVFLTYSNRSFYYSVIDTLRYKNKLLTGIVLLVLILLLALIYIPFLAQFFELKPLQWVDWMLVISVSSISVFWFEGLKWWKRKQERVKK